MDARHFTVNQIKLLQCKIPCSQGLCYLDATACTQTGQKVYISPEEGMEHALELEKIISSSPQDCADLIHVKLVIMVEMDTGGAVCPQYSVGGMGWNTNFQLNWGF